MFSIGSSIELCMKWCLDHSFRMVVVLKYWIYVCVGDEKKPVHFHFILKLEPLLLSLFCSRSNSNSQFESNFWSNNWPEKWWSKLKNSFFKKFHKIFFFCFFVYHNCNDDLVIWSSSSSSLDFKVIIIPGNIPSWLVEKRKKTSYQFNWSNQNYFAQRLFWLLLLIMSWLYISITKHDSTIPLIVDRCEI